ncbi:DNA-3-methyladenine glycosylase [Ventosimonas gracilis]|uniref:DNA-3-methyladenine glycosylase n=1 Tax=Ventosimonas gracilis TaxID=1680762 RepID=UPI000A5DF495|nr:DNA-3-methyladenine glycosylase [Ventosimonas gracilis]
MPSTQVILLSEDFFARDAQSLACALLGKIIRHRTEGLWLAARIIETESYYKNEKGSHASLGFTHNRRALFMPPGTIYMYYARGGDSLNFSAQGEGNAVLIKSAYPVLDEISGEASLQRMQQLNPDKQGRIRAAEKLCAGQTLLCKSLGLKVPDWNAKRLNERLHLEQAPPPKQIIQTRRLGIPIGRDEDLPYRFVDAAYARHCTKNPLRLGQLEGRDYWLLTEKEGSWATF